MCIYVKQRWKEGASTFFQGIYKFKFSQSKLRLPFGVVLTFGFGFVSPE